MIEVWSGGLPRLVYSVLSYLVQQYSNCRTSLGAPAMPGVRNFSDLEIWKRTRSWSKDIFEATQIAPFAKDQRLVNQVNDSSESVMSNIAEGFGRGTQEEFITFLGYALGSLMETQSHLCAAF